MALPFVRISFELVHMHLRTRVVYFLLFESEFFGENVVLRTTSSSAIIIIIIIFIEETFSQTWFSKRTSEIKIKTN